VSRFVATTAIRLAVGGRGGDVLDAIGIGWRSGHPHIDCPYPGHGGKDDWRWDEKKSRAFCTCITKSDSIFDVLMKVKGIDFEAAKICAAELIGRSDLIRETSGTGRQATDAASLLNAPVGNRDDTLPIAYLAHRLGVVPDGVPIPATPIVGLKSLGYYDPPAQGSKAKPNLIGEHPCAVFGTIAADRGKHAHRIYLAPGGRGKADLGIGPHGQARDPKKSAKIIGDDNSAGRSVLWGNPSSVPHIVVTEGIETGCAVALALQAEIDAGEIAVAAAITAGGVEAFQIYPVTKCVTVAADRDEGEKNGKPGSRRGERAARTFGIRHYQRIEVGIALPGAPGESIDWLNVLLRDAVDAVRSGITAAVSFVPTRAELDAAAQSQRRAAELEEIARQYPLPAMDTVALQYAHTPAGRVKIHKLVEIMDERILVPVATPIGVPARLRFADQCDAYGLRCTVQDMNGQSRAIDFDRAALPRMAATDIRSLLFAAGLRTEADGESVVVQIFKAADPQREIVAMRRSGWHKLAGAFDPIFIAPDGAIIGPSSEIGVELAMSARLPPDIAQAGTADGWREAIAAALSAKRCPHWAIGIIAGFAGPLIDLTGLSTCGINLSGLSSSGKSLAQQLAVSAWSSPRLTDDGLSQSARATDNAIEGMASRANGTVLSLDELGHVNGKLVAKIIYTIAGGVGKQRMTSDADMRQNRTWATFAILSGESSLEERIRSDGGEWMAGMAVRIVDVDVTGVNRKVDKATLRAIEGIERNYGHAGPAFVRALIDAGAHRRPIELRDRINNAATELAGRGASGTLIRAALPLAILLVAGELARGFGLIPTATDVKGAIKWAWSRFKSSGDAAPLDPESQILSNLRTWIAERWDVTVKPVDAHGGVNNREALAWYDDVAVYIPKGRIREAAGNATKETQIGAILSRLHLLVHKPKADRFCVRWVPNVGRVTAYALSREAFGRSDKAADTDRFKVYRGGRDGDR
jgi:hypothetical protein